MSWLLVASLLGFAGMLWFGFNPPRAVKKRSARSGWWAFVLLGLVVWGVGSVSNLQSAARRETAHTLATLPVVAVETALADARFQDRPIALSGVATCQATPSAPSGALATRTRFSGQDEVEHDEGPDTITVVDYGAEHDVAPFSLGPVGASAPALALADPHFTVLPSEQGTTTTRSTGEYSAALGGELAEYTTVQAIPCGAEVTLTGVVSKDAAGAATFAPLPSSLALLTDRRWPSVVGEAQRFARSSEFWGGLWLGVGLFWTALMAFFGRFVRA